MATARFSEQVAALVTAMDRFHLPALLFALAQAITALTVAVLGKSGYRGSRLLAVALREESQ